MRNLGCYSRHIHIFNRFFGGANFIQHTGAPIITSIHGTKYLSIYKCVQTLKALAQKSGNRHCLSNSNQWHTKKRESTKIIPTETLLTFSIQHWNGSAFSGVYTHTSLTLLIQRNRKQVIEVAIKILCTSANQ